jgi:hypothetical protein
MKHIKEFQLNEEKRNIDFSNETFSGEQVNTFYKLRNLLLEEQGLTNSEIVDVLEFLIRFVKIHFPK